MRRLRKYTALRLRTDGSKIKRFDATVYKTDGTSYEISFDKNEALEILQKAVGGLIQRISLKRGMDLILNEEGGLLGLDSNPWSSSLSKGTIWEHGFFVGPIVLIKGTLK